MLSENQQFEYDNDSSMKVYPTLQEQCSEDPHLEKFIQHLPKNMISRKILDVGCGTGDIAKQLATLNPQSYVLGIDVSERMVEVARHSKPLENVDFKLMDMFHMEGVEDKSIDFVLSVYSIHVKHPDDLVILFKHIGSKLKKGGTFKFFTNTIAGKDGSPLSKEILDSRVFHITLGTMYGKIFKLPNFGVLQDELTHALVESGFSCIDINCFDRSEKMSEDYKFRNKISIVEVWIEAVLL